MNSRRRWLAMVVCALLLIGTAAGAPNALRRWDAFSVEHVEVRGTRYLAAYDALVQSGITRESNIFDDFEPWRAKLLQHPLVLTATIERRLPNTIRVAITETEPVVLARTPELMAVDARGRALPIDPATVDLDVPLLGMQSRPNAQGVFADPMTRQVIDVLAALQRRDSRLYSWVSEASQMKDGVLLELRSPAGAQALLTGDARTLRLTELQIALADLAVRGELSRLQRIDARYHDQIVVTLAGSGSGPRSTFPGDTN